MRPVAGGNVAIVDPGPLRLVVEAERVLVAHGMRRAMGKGHGVTSQGAIAAAQVALVVFAALDAPASAFAAGLAGGNDLVILWMNFHHSAVPASAIAAPNRIGRH